MRIRSIVVFILQEILVLPPINLFKVLEYYFIFLLLNIFCFCFNKMLCPKYVDNYKNSILMIFNYNCMKRIVVHNSNLLQKFERMSTVTIEKMIVFCWFELVDYNKKKRYTFSVAFENIINRMIILKYIFIWFKHISGFFFYFLLASF